MLEVTVPSVVSVIENASGVVPDTVMFPDVCAKAAALIRKTTTISNSGFFIVPSWSIRNSQPDHSREAGRRKVLAQKPEFHRHRDEICRSRRALIRGDSGSAQNPRSG